ncbi:MAG: hypothetical protein ACXIU5_04545 [Halomonadaceae bacterium]|jgi:thymidylate kinase|uniref:hypothetical protein n=1 Tax=Halomonas sp. MCCC 1A11062 TaxID=2733485 RepID=UPI001F448113|nr:hypothetical protein [Halomonas sp. MCCC 1A11062]MCE8037282.1 hypothetical protein [Halomonas sp. MCCC 1A11062]
MSIGVLHGSVPQAGRIVVISGIDGAGKSTVVESLTARLATTQRVALVSGGKPQAAWLERLRLGLRKASSNDGAGRSQSRHKTRIFRDALPGIVLALLRWRLSRRARRLALAGVTVVADRWPTLEYGKMDGPKIARDQPGLNGAILRLLAGLENAIYRRVEPADVAFFLIVDESTAIQRNAERVKAGKESAEDIKRRYRENLDYQPIARRVERIDNSGTLADVLALLEHNLERDR